MGPPWDGNIFRPLQDMADRQPNAIAVEGVDARWTYSGLRDRAHRVAEGLLARGRCPGDRVALVVQRSPEVVAGLYGIWRAGCVAVPMSPLLPEAQRDHILQRSGSAEILDPEAALGGTEASASTSGGPSLPPTDRFGDDPAALLFTSGSTGLPKGIAVSHRNLLAGADIVAGYLSMDASDRLLSVLPLHFDYGLNQLLTCIGTGATLVLPPSSLPGAICRALAERRITGLAGVPPLWVQLFRTGSPLLEGAAPHLRFMTNSGGASPWPCSRPCADRSPTPGST